MTRAEVLQIVADQYGTVPAYLWRKYPHYAVLRHADGGKWYGLVMNVTRQTLGLTTGPTDVDILVVKALPEEIDILKQGAGFFPVYQMNKTNWVTVRLADPTAAAQVPQLLAESFQLTSR